MSADSTRSATNLIVPGAARTGKETTSVRACAQIGRGYRERCLVPAASRLRAVGSLSAGGGAPRPPHVAPLDLRGDHMSCGGLGRPLPPAAAPGP